MLIHIVVASSAARLLSRENKEGKRRKKKELEIILWFFISVSWFLFFIHFSLALLLPCHSFSLTLKPSPAHFSQCLTTPLKGESGETKGGARSLTDYFYFLLFFLCFLHFVPLGLRVWKTVKKTRDFKGRRGRLRDLAWRWRGTSDEETGGRIQEKNHENITEIFQRQLIWFQHL